MSLIFQNKVIDISYLELPLNLSHCCLTIKGALSGLRQFLATESPLKMMKNAFYFTSKALFVLKIFKFLSWLFGHIAKRLILISNFRTSQCGWQTIVIHILPNILRSKGNQAIKFGQLIERNMRHIFFKKSYTKCDGEISPRHFYEKLKLSISLDQ